LRRYIVVMAWEEVAVLRAAGAQLAARHQAIFRAILALGVMLTTLVTVKADQGDGIDAAGAAAIM